MFPIDRIEQEFVHKDVERWHFDHEHACRREQQHFDSFRERVQVRHMGKHVRAGNRHRRPISLSGCLRGRHIEEPRHRGQTLLTRHLGQFVHRLDAANPCPGGAEPVEQYPNVAADVHCEVIASERERVHHGLGQPEEELPPSSGRIGRIGVVIVKDRFLGDHVG